MKGVTYWQYHPFLPLDRQAETLLPYIARIAPTRFGARLEWFDRGYGGGHTLCFRRHRGESPMEEVALAGPEAVLDGLAEECDYEMFVRRDGAEGKSMLRLFRTGFVPGDAVVHYLHPLDDAYAFSGKALCSPSIAILPSGRFVVSMDLFAGRRPQNLTLLYYSDDQGATWHYLNDLFPCYWGKLFVHRGRLHMLAHAAEYGDLLIGASDDEGATWTAPTPIFRGSGMFCASGPHKAPMPVIEHGGRLCTAIDFGSWEADRGHGQGMLSIDAGSDLLKADNWALSDSFLRYDPSWPGAVVGQSSGALEGNMVVSPKGELINMLRYQINDAQPNHGRAIQLLADADRPEKPLAFLRIVEMNGGSNSKFQLRQDPATKKYFAICSEYVDGMPNSMRSVLSLAASDDLISWKIVKRLVDYRHLPPGDTGFQYCDFQFNGEDIVFVCRTAFNRPRNYHDANYTTFHIIKNFHSLA
ncbi:MAG: glycoside hydrolase [Clostridiales bacterium]|jgi:hypothetical protein|nr:glycoside hydrolase [Clostridiales bacterium]